jgi:hypothetical protein
MFSTFIQGVVGINPIVINLDAAIKESAGSWPKQRRTQDFCLLISRFSGHSIYIYTPEDGNNVSDAFTAVS